MFGKDISYSISPIIHNAAFKHHSLSHTYEILETETVDELASIITSLDSGGASVTVSHTLLISKYCTSICPHTENIGAVNTLVPSSTIIGPEYRQITGYNTNWIGLIACLKSRNTDIVECATTALGQIPTLIVLEMGLDEI